MDSELDFIFERIRALCVSGKLTFAQVVTEAFFLFDDEFEAMTDRQVSAGIKAFEERLDV